MSGAPHTGHKTSTTSLYSGDAGAATDKWLPLAPVKPRASAPAAIVVSAAEEPSAAEYPTLVRFLSKEAVKAAAAGAASPLAAADAERESVSVAYEGGRRVVSVSLGAELDKVTGEGIRKAGVAAVAKLKALKVDAAAFVVPAVAGAPLAKVAEALVQAVALSNWAFDKYLTTEDKVPAFVTKIHVSFAPESPAAAVAEAAAAARTQATLCDAVVFARDLGNDRADEVHPQRLEEVAREIAAETGARLYVLAGEALVAEGMHLMAAVGQAARFPPRYIELLHNGDPEHPEDVIMVLGKGITYDTGGLNIKGTGFMEDMHMDMCGSAVALSCARAAHRAGLKRNVLFVAAVAENAIGGLAYKPKSIIRSHKGLTVEIGNTDAEGRLVLADALSLAQERHRPHTIVDLATLTGACIVALGEYAAGLFGNNAALKAALQAAGEARGERLHPMPIYAEHREELRASAMSDLQSTGAGRYGGACTAAAFLEEFIGPKAKNARVARASAAGGAAAAAEPAPAKPAWCHIDLAGPAMYTRARGHVNQGATGFGVQTIMQFLMSAPAGALPQDEAKRF